MEQHVRIKKWIESRFISSTLSVIHMSQIFLGENFLTDYISMNEEKYCVKFSFFSTWQMITSKLLIIDKNKNGILSMWNYIILYFSLFQIRIVVIIFGMYKLTDVR